MNRTVCLVVLSCVAGLIPIAAAEEPANSATNSQPSAAVPDWVRVGQSRYDWKWLVERCDRDADGVVTESELPLSAATFARLDRTWDGKLTGDDFDWSMEGELRRQKETTFALFKVVDKNSDGRIAAEEWQAMFAKVAQDQNYLIEEDLERLIYLPRVVKTANEMRLRTGRSEFSPERMKPRGEVPRPGDLAPDFELTSPDGNTTVKLSSFRGQKPVVLIFGCFTCGNYRTYSQPLEELYKHWKDEAEFLRVYVREAHPVGENQPATPTNQLAGIVFKQPITFEERCDIAATFMSTMQVKTPLVVDEIDNRVGQAYGAWPDRLYVVDRDGHIAFTGGPGPFGFNPREMEQSLAMMLIDQNKKK